MSTRKKDVKEYLDRMRENDRQKKENPIRNIWIGWNGMLKNELNLMEAGNRGMVL